ncbi:MAG: protoporphyrinogen oxidase [Alphaproteobacteria bacterium]
MTGSVLIVGGGITGLSTAWFLQSRGVPVRVLEAAATPGGMIDTDRGGGWLTERGPNSTLHKPGRAEDSLGRLIAGAGLTARVLEAGRAGSKRFILRDGRLVALPGSPPAMIATRAFSLGGKLRLLAEPFIGRARVEETIAAFVRRRLGREFLDYAVEPFVSGVYAGDPAALSVQAAVPRIYDLERRHGSLIRGAIALGRAARGAGMPAGRLISFDHGMAVLPETLAQALPPGAVRCGCRVDSLHQVAGGWQVGWQGKEGAGTDTAERLVLALPAGDAARLVRPLAPAAADLLDSVPYAPIVAAALGFPRAAVGHPLDGFGFLVPRREGMRTLGALFSSTLFPGRGPESTVLITAFIGGAMDSGIVAESDDRIASQVREDLGRALTIDGAPVLTRLWRRPRAIPQYTLGHLARMAALDEALAPLAGLHLQASWRGGVSVADCVRSGETLAQRIIDG